MYGLPPACEVKKQLPKKAIYAKFNLNAAQRDNFDADIARLDIVGCVSTTTIPALAPSEGVQEFYVLQVQLKHREYDSRNIALLTKLIPQKLVFAMHFEEEVQFSIFHSKLISSGWVSVLSASLPISGFNLDSVWDNIVRRIGQIEMQQGKSLIEQIAVNDQRDKLNKQIAALQNKIRKEKQFNRQVELRQQLTNLQQQLSQL